MSAVGTAPRTRKESRVQFALIDWKTITKRNLVTYIRKPDLLVFSTIQPVMFVLLFVYVWGGAMQKSLPAGVPYIDFLMPGIFVQTAIFAALQTGVGLADDLQKGLIDRFRSLPKLLLGFLMVVMVGYSFTWVAAFAGLSLKTVEAVQAATFTLVFPLVFASSAFVPDTTFPSWLQAWSHINPVSIWAETFRALTLGHLYTNAPVELVGHVPPLGTLILQSTLWFAAILAVFVPLGVRVYRRT
jgi:ABC-2 type transport system permease protein